MPIYVTTVHQTSKQDEICCTCRSRCHSKKGCPCRAANVLCTERCHIQHSCTNIQIPEDAATIDLTQYDDQKISTQSRKGPSKWICCGEVTLTNEHMKTLQSEREWIDDDLIHAGQTLLQNQHPYMGGLQKPALSAQFAMEPNAGEFIQILCIRNNHWICVSTVGCQPSTINVFDSMYGFLDRQMKKLIADIMQTREKQIKVHYCDVQWQSGGSDCGLFAVAFATSICCGVDPTTVAFEQRFMREHFLDCLQTKTMTMFPVRNNLRRPKQPKKENVSVFCVCRLIDDGTQMVQCSSCQEWYHQTCVRVPQHILESEELEWQCASCK